MACPAIPDSLERQRASNSYLRSMLAGDRLLLAQDGRSQGGLVNDDRDRPQSSEPETIGITTGPEATFVGIDAKHLKIDHIDTSDEKLTHDKSWKTKVEEEPGGPGDA
jgi:hypothetical protein